MGLFGAAGHSPNQVALATRKVCQNDEILERLASCFPNSWSIAAHSDRDFGNQRPRIKGSGLGHCSIWGPSNRRAATAAGASNRWRRPPLTSLWASHISAKPESMAIARIWLRFCPLNLGLLNPHSFGGCSRIGACSATRHDELIGRLVDHVMAATPNSNDRNLA